MQRIEGGETVKLTSLIRVLRALELLGALDRLVAEPIPSQIELLRLGGRQRRRASGERSKGGPGHELRSSPNGRHAP